MNDHDFGARNYVTSFPWFMSINPMDAKYEP